MSQPADQDLTITRGDTTTIVVSLVTDDGVTPINITGRTYRAQIRSKKDSTSIAASFTCAITDAANGKVTCTLSAANAATLKPGLQYWDFEETASGVVTTILAGIVTVLADVTR